MGGGSSVPNSPSKNRPKVDPFEQLFISSSVERIESQSCSDALFRTSFIEFIKNGRWVDKLAVHEELVEDHEQPTIWAQYGYVCPPRRRDDASSKFSLNSSASFQTLGTLLSDASSRNSSVKDSGKMAMSGEVVPHWPLCATPEDVRAIMLVLLAPMYFASPEFKYLAYPHIAAAYSSSSGSEKQDHHASSPRSTHLREMMLSAAAAFDSAELEVYLSKATPTLIADFKKALSNMPLRFNVLDVDLGSSSPPMSLYECSGKAMTFSSRSARSLVELTSGAAEPPSPLSSSIATLGRSFFSSDYTPEQQQLVDTALAEQARLKLAVTTSYDRCALHALKPVCTAAGEVRYMLSAETLNKVSISKASNEGQVHARVFQQMDDLLLLLPALIKTE